MNTGDFVIELRKMSVNLKQDGENILVDAPKNILTPSLLKSLQKHKKAIIKLLKSENNVSFDQRTQKRWLSDFVQSGQASGHRSFRLHPWLYVIDVDKYCRSILIDLNNPRSARCRFGSAQKDIGDLWNYFKGINNN